MKYEHNNFLRGLTSCPFFDDDRKIKIGSIMCHQCENFIYEKNITKNGGEIECKLKRIEVTSIKTKNIISKFEFITKC